MYTMTKLELFKYFIRALLEPLQILQHTLYKLEFEGEKKNLVPPDVSYFKWLLAYYVM